MQAQRRKLEAAARDYARSVKAMEDAHEGSAHWQARRNLSRDQQVLNEVAIVLGWTELAGVNEER